MNDSSREKQLAKNTFILSLGMLSSKIFTFLLLPIYTTALAAEDYGNVDVLQSIIYLAMPLVTLQIQEGVFRFLIDRENMSDRSSVISTSFFFVSINDIIFVLLSIIYNKLIGLPYYYAFITAFVASSYAIYLQYIVRGLGHNVVYSISSFLIVFVSLITNIFLIVGMGFKGNSILIAIAASNFAAVIFITFKERIWRYIKIGSISRVMRKKLVQYCLPLVPNSISWWVVNASDRLLIVLYLGSAANGIYAAAHKIPTIYTTIYNIFNLAWAEAVSRAVNDDDCECFINQMLARSYKFFGCICLGITCILSLTFKFIIGSEYAMAYGQIYILMLAIYINSICSMYGGIFTGFKKPKIIGSTTVAGAVVNVLVNVVLIKFIGLYAASISTLVSYTIIMFVRAKSVAKIINLKWPIKFFIRMAIAFLIVSFGYFYRHNIVNGIILCGLFVWTIIENQKILKSLIQVVFSKILGKKVISK